jgi:hypothetical protein
MNIASRYIDESFDINNCLHYTLSIRFSPDGFSFSVFDQSINKFIVFSSYHLNAVSPFMLNNDIKSIVASEPMLQKSYYKVKAMYAVAKCTLAPMSLTDGKMNEQLFKFTNETERDEMVFSREVQSGIYSISSIPKPTKKLIEELFVNVIFFSPLCNLISLAASVAPTGKHLLVEIAPHFLKLVVFIDGKLKMFNYYQTMTDDDVLYYTLNMLKKMNVYPEGITLVGDIDYPSTLTNILKKYFKNVKTATYNVNYLVSNTFKGMQPQIQLPVLELALCG